MDTHDQLDDERDIPFTSSDGGRAVETGTRSRPPIAVAAAAAVGVIAALALVFAFVGGDDASTDAGGDAISNLAFLTTDGSNATLADFEGDPLVVNFFASWCAPCRAELPDLEQVHQARIDEVTFLGINHDLDESTWRSFVQETEITFQTVFQPDQELFTALDAKGMPTTVLLSADGEVLHLHTGLLTDELLEELIDEHLGEA